MGEPLCQLDGFVHLIFEDELTEFAGSAAAETDNSLLMGGENLLVDPRNIVIAFQEGDGGHANEVAKSGAILGEQGEVKAGVAAAAGFPVGAFAGGHISFVTEDRIDARGPAFLIKLNSPVEVAVIRESQGVHPQLFGARNQLGNSAGAVEQAVMTVAVQMNEGSVRHKAP